MATTVAKSGYPRHFSPQNYTLCHCRERNRGGQGRLRDFFNRDKYLSAAPKNQLKIQTFLQIKRITSKAKVISDLRDGSVTDRIPDGRETVAGAFPERTDDAPPVHIRIPLEEVNVTELRQNPSRCLARVRRGARIKVTSRGRVVAELAPPSPDDVAVARARLRDNVRRYERPLEPIIDLREWDMNR